MRSIAIFILRIFGWRLINGISPDLKKFVVIVAPHTSWKDFFLCLLVRAALKKKIYYLAKRELFDSLFGFFFWWTGGRPVDRKNKTGLVDQVVKLFNGSDEFAIAVAPEGTRKQVQNFKSGFYYIAREAKVPIIACLLDYENKQARFLTPYYPTDDAKTDLDHLWSMYDGVKGADPAKGITGRRSEG
jgi:1-acyl-sn-glycerol-3-phosphate acyltransferase